MPQAHPSQIFIQFEITVIIYNPIMRSTLMNKRPIKNVGIISTRIAGTDGVSLEIEKWVEVLKRNRFECFYFAGEIDRDEEVSYKIEEAHFEHLDVADMNKSLFGATKRTRKISKNIHKIQEKLKSALYDFHKKFKIDLIIS